MNKDALKDLCLRYLDGDLADKDAHAFNRLITESKDAALMLARLSINDSRFEVTTAFLTNADTSIAPSDHLMDEMLRANEGPLHWASRPKVDNTLTDETTPDRMSFQQAMSLTGFALRQAAKTGPAKKLAVAAAVMFVALIAWQLMAPAPPQELTPPPVATTGDLNTNVAPTDPTPRGSIVATLTASNNATWAEGALAPGSSLRPGDRLTLTAGFAEITTEEGAVVILEAPATLELLDKKNALQLHSGKLVGICETESSKGFVVRTPHMDVTDLGTRFGVAIDDAGNTLAEVFEGSIRVDAREQSLSGFASIDMVAGDVVAVDRVGVRSEDDSLSDALFAGLREYIGETISQGILGFSGDIQWIDKDALLAGGTNTLPQSDKVWVYTEFKDYELTEDLAVTMGRGHRYFKLTADQYETIAKGTRISSYIVGFNPAPTDGATSASPTFIQGQVVFDRQIYGLIATDAHWKRFDELLYGDVSGGLIQTAPGMMVEVQLENRAEGDKLDIQPFRRKLDLRLDATDSPDLVRIIVLENPHSKKP